MRNQKFRPFPFRPFPKENMLGTDGINEVLISSPLIPCVPRTDGNGREWTELFGDCND